MKKYLASAAIAAIALSSAPAFAQSGGAHMTGTVQPVCEVQDVFASLAFSSMNIGQQINDGVVLKCNDADGATIKLSSSEGGMESDDNEDQEIEYTATLTSGPIAGGSVQLLLPVGLNGDNDASASDNVAGGVALAGGASGNLNVILTETALFAGGYSDTLTVTLTSI